MPRRVPLPPHLRRTAFRVGDAAFHGLGVDRLRSADVDAPHHGIRAVGLDATDLVDRCRAAQAAFRGDAVFSHTTAVRLHGAPLPFGFDALEVSALGGTRMRRPGIRGHEIDAGTAVVRMPTGLRVVAPATAFCQVASLLAPEDLVAVGDALVSGVRRTAGARTRPACTIDDLADAVERHGSRRGARILRWALPLVRTGVDARTESVLRLVLVEAGLPEPVTGYVVQTPDGPRVPDLAFPRDRIAFEYEGDHHRTDRTQWRRDFSRVRAFQAAGWTVLRVSAHDLRTSATRAALVAQVRRVLSARR